MKKEEVNNLYIYTYKPHMDDMDHVNSCPCQPWQELDLYLENSADFFRQLSVRRSAREKTPVACGDETGLGVCCFTVQRLTFQEDAFLCVFFNINRASG